MFDKLDQYLTEFNFDITWDSKEAMQRVSSNKHECL